MTKKPTDPVSFRKGYLHALDDCEQLLRELGFDDAKEIIDDLRKKNKSYQRTRTEGIKDA